MEKEIKRGKAKKKQNQTDIVTSPPFAHNGSIGHFLQKLAGSLRYCGDTWLGPYKYQSYCLALSPWLHISPRFGFVLVLLSFSAFNSI